MRSFDEIYAIAADRKGGAAALEARLDRARPIEEVAAMPDHRWLAIMARCIFEAGFNWKVIEAKWPGFETAFEGFDPARVAFYAEADLDRLLADPGIVRNGAKIAAVIKNAQMLRELADEYGSAAVCFARWPDRDFIDLVVLLSKRGGHLGGITGQRALRRGGRPAFVMTGDVTARLVAEGVISKSPTSRADWRAVQEAFNIWAAQSGRDLTQISQVLALSL